jgi:hypothetical protein
VRTISGTVDPSPIYQKFMHTLHTQQTAPKVGRLAQLQSIARRLPEAEARLAAERKAHAETKAEIARLNYALGVCDELKAMIDAKSEAPAKPEAKPAPAPVAARQTLHGLARAAAAINAKFPVVRH